MMGDQLDPIQTKEVTIDHDQIMKRHQLLELISKVDEQVKMVKQSNMMNEEEKLKTLRSLFNERVILFLKSLGPNQEKKLEILNKRNEIWKSTEDRLEKLKNKTPSISLLISRIRQEILGRELEKLKGSIQKAQVEPTQAEATTAESMQIMEQKSSNKHEIHDQAMNNQKMTELEIEKRLLDISEEIKSIIHGTPEMTQEQKRSAFKELEKMALRKNLQKMEPSSRLSEIRKTLAKYKEAYSTSLSDRDHSELLLRQTREEAFEQELERLQNNAIRPSSSFLGKYIGPRMFKSCDEKVTTVS